MQILSVANVDPDPDSGAAGTVYQTNLAFKRLGHSVDEIWRSGLGRQFIKHANLNALMEQPRRYKAAVSVAHRTKSYDLTIVQQPQSYLAAMDHQKYHRSGLFLTFSQGVENRIGPLVDQWQRASGMDRRTAIRRFATPVLQRLLRRQWPMAVKYSDAVIVQHSEDMKYIIEMQKEFVTPVEVCPSGLLDVFVKTPLKPMDEQRLSKLLFVGQFAFYKGIGFLITIINHLLLNNSSLCFTWVCASKDHQTALMLFDEHIHHRIKFLDWLPQHELIKIYDDHGVLIFPTIAEGFAKVPLEAMSRGVCVVASNCCGMKDYISDGKNGLLCDVGDINGLISKAESLTRSAVEAAKLAGKARNTAISFTWENSAQKIIDFSEKIFASHSEGAFKDSSM